MGLATKLVPGLDEILKLANKFIPDKDAQVELEKKIMEANQEIIKSNKTLLEKVVPITFPLCVWTLVVFAFVQMYVGIQSLRENGVWLAIPFPTEIFQLAFVFVCGLVGKWNVKEFFMGKKDKEDK